MRTFLKLLFAAILIAMIIVTVRASLTVSLWSVWSEYAANPWAVATLWDAYCGFTIFACWLCYREPSMTARIVWCVLIAALGNIATSAYLLLQLSRLRKDDPLQVMLGKRS